MAWFDKLKALLNIEVNKELININLKDLIHIEFKNKSDNKIKSDNEFEYTEAERKLEILLDNLTSERREQLKPIIKEAIEADYKLLEEETANLLDKLYKYNSDPGEDAQIKRFFEGIIPPADYDALESALYLRREFSNDGDVSKLKKDIRKKFGDRGGNIANLCTAGYFEGFLMPLYNNASAERFGELYESIVGRSIIAIFVHRNMQEDEIARQITTKVEACERYGIDFLHIHGIGQKNIQKIKEFIEEQKEFFDFFEKNIYESEDKDIIIVGLLLK